MTTGRDPIGPGGAVDIGPAWAHELSALPGIEARAGQLFRAVGRDDVADGAPYGIDALRLARRRGDVIVARDGAGPVGFAVVASIDAGLHLDELSVDPRRARAGVGTRLLEAVVDLAAARGLAGVTLTTFAEVPWNGPWYRRRGFEPMPPSAWTPDLRARVADEASRGLAPDERWVMWRPCADTAGGRRR